MLTESTVQPEMTLMMSTYSQRCLLMWLPTPCRLDRLRFSDPTCRRLFSRSAQRGNVHGRTPGIQTHDCRSATGPDRTGRTCRRRDSITPGVQSFFILPQRFKTFFTKRPNLVHEQSIVLASASWSTAFRAQLPGPGVVRGVPPLMLRLAHGVSLSTRPCIHIILS